MASAAGTRPDEMGTDATDQSQFAPDCQKRSSAASQRNGPELPKH
jgi:hypothetical protein